jgi:hypothetical protein
MRIDKQMFQLALESQFYDQNNYFQNICTTNILNHKPSILQNL